MLAKRGQSNPTGRVDDTAELGDACAFLCAASSGFIVSQNLSTAEPLTRRWAEDAPPLRWRRLIRISATNVSAERVWWSGFVDRTDFPRHRINHEGCNVNYHSVRYFNF